MSKSSDYWFENSINDQLKEKSIKGGFNTVIGQLITFSLSILSLLILARILTPADFGLVAMVAAISGFIEIIKDLGLSSSIIQKDKINRLEVTSLFWFNLLFSLVLGLGLYLFAPLIALFFNDARIIEITKLYALGIFLSNISIIHYALLNRKMKFYLIVQAQVIASVISILIGVGMAIWIKSYWAIVYMNVAKPIISSFLFFYICNWRPNFSFNLKIIEHHLNFGIGVSGFNVINYFSRAMDNILIGRMLGAQILGFYSKAYQLLMLPLNQLRNPLSSVALPALSSINKQPDKYATYYYKLILLLSFFSMPLISFMSIYANEIILLFLGNQWINAVSLFQLLAISAFIQPIAGTRGLILMSFGFTKKYFIWGVINAFFVISAFVIGIQWDIKGLILGYAIVNYLLLYPSLAYCFKNTPLKIKAFNKIILKPAFFSLTTSVVTYFIHSVFIDKLMNVYSLILGLIIFIIIYLAQWYLIPRDRKEIKEIKNILMLVFRKYFSN